LNDWYGTYTDGNGNFPALLYNASATQQSYFPSHTVDIHPGPNQLGIIAWHSPLNGYISITGGVADNDPACGDGVLWYLNRKSAVAPGAYVELASGSIFNGGTQNFAGGSGGNELNAVAVGSEDIIYLSIHPNGSYYCDNTKIDLKFNVTTAPISTPIGTPPNGTPLPPTPTPPTPTTPCDCAIDFLRLGDLYCYIHDTVEANGKFAAPMQQAILDVQLFHRIEDEILSQTPEGQHYIDLYYGHGIEIIQILKDNPELKDEAVTTLQLWEPSLQALVDGQGSNTAITSAQVQAVQTFLDHLYTVGSMELKQTITNEQALNPLEQTIGQTMDQASISLVDYQVPPAVTPTETPTNTVTATITPLPTSTATNTATITPLPTSTPTKTATFTPTPSKTSTATAVSGSIFVDGFESGNFSAWNWATTNGGDLSVSAQAAAVGSYGMRAVVNDNNELVVYDQTPNSEKHYSARFYFDPNSIQVTGTNGFYLLGISAAPGWAACLNFEQQGAYYSLNLCGKNDAGNWLESDSVLIADQWQAVEVEWQASSAVGTNDGFIKLYIGDQLAASLNHIDSDTQSITEIMWGATGISGASGSMYFDAFESRTGAHIGLIPNGPSVFPAPTRPDTLFTDEFESGTLSTWNPILSTTDGGDLSISAAAAQQSNYGLQALIDDTASIKALDASPAHETHYQARFYFNPNSLAMSSGNAHYIFEGVDTSDGAILFRLELIYENGIYKLRPRVINDTYSYILGNKQTITNNWHVVELEWKASSTQGANNGLLSLWIDNTLAQTIVNVDNDTQRLDQVKLGAVTGVDATTSGSMFFDHFVSHRNTYIGP